MIESVINYAQYLFFEYIGLIIATLGLYLVYSKKVWVDKKNIIFYLGYVLLILGTLLFIYRIIFS